MSLDRLAKAVDAELLFKEESERAESIFQLRRESKLVRNAWQVVPTIRVFTTIIFLTESTEILKTPLVFSFFFGQCGAEKT